MKKYCLLLMLSVITTTAHTQELHKLDDGLFWSLESGVLTISGEGQMPNWKYYEKHPWETKIIKKVIIQDGVSSIGNYAFSGCKNLTSIEIPNSVKEIKYNAISNCESLTSIVIPNSVQHIRSYAFSDCKNLTSIEIPNSVKEIEHGVISNCESLTSIVIPNPNCSYSSLTFDQYRGQVSVAVNGPNNLVYHLIREDGLWGLIDNKGDEIIPCELSLLEKAGKGFLRFKVGSFYGIMNMQGKVIIPTDRGYTYIGKYVSITKRFPYGMDGYKGECNEQGVQVSKIKVEKTQQQPVASNSTSSSTSKSSSSSSSSSTASTNTNKSSGNKTTTVVVEHHRDPVPFQEWQACWACGGMGTMGCDNCGGSGTKYIGDRLHRCSRCNGRGIIPCNVCYGNKGQYITVYR